MNAESAKLIGQAKLEKETGERDAKRQRLSLDKQRLDAEIEANIKKSEHDRSIEDRKLAMKEEERKDRAKEREAERLDKAAERAERAEQMRMFAQMVAAVMTGKAVEG